MGREDERSRTCSGTIAAMVGVRGQYRGGDRHPSSPAICGVLGKDDSGGLSAPESQDMVCKRMYPIDYLSIHNQDRAP
jgi:hypothetical protein